MKKEPKLHLFFLNQGSSEQFLPKISTVFNTEFKLLNEDYDRVSWGSESLGLFFILKLNIRDLDNPLKSYFSLTMQPSLKFHPEGEYEFVSLDDHFQAFLSDAGFNNVLNEKEFGEYLDKLDID